MPYHIKATNKMNPPINDNVINIFFIASVLLFSSLCHLDSFYIPGTFLIYT